MAWRGSGCSASPPPPASPRSGCVCGRLSLDPASLKAVGIQRAYALTELEPDVPRCLAQAGPLLERVAARMARDFLPV